jgi:hypothetical protein
MNRHKFNIFPEAKTEDYERLKGDIRSNGFDKRQPIVLFEGDILDGWNRQKACDELGVKPTYETFAGTSEEAIAYMMRTNKRRNLNSGQWATIAVEAEELISAIQSKVKENKGGRPRKMFACSKCSELFTESDIGHCDNCGHHYTSGSECSNCHKSTIKKTVSDTGNTVQEWLANASPPEKPTQKIESVSRNEKSTAHKTAELFNTNRTYVNQAAKLKSEAPEIFEKVKAGTMRMTDAARAANAIPKDDWRKDERDRQSQVNSGTTVVANQSNDKNLIAWAEREGHAIRIDRSSKYGNPFVMDQDGDRDFVCDCFENHYLPHKPSIKRDIPRLKGKVLICHCYPNKCHGDTLARMANEQ